MKHSLVRITQHQLNQAEQLGDSVPESNPFDKLALQNFSCPLPNNVQRKTATIPIENIPKTVNSSTIQVSF